jgi:hypothetical protein
MVELRLVTRGLDDGGFAQDDATTVWQREGQIKLKAADLSKYSSEEARAELSWCIHRHQESDCRLLQHGCQQRKEHEKT